MKIAIIGCRCHWRLRGRQARLGWRGRHLHRARCESGGDAPQRRTPDHERWQRARAANVAAVHDYAGAGPQDLVILAVKAHQVEAVASDVPRLFGPDTAVVTMQNGVPYWYFHQHGGALAGSVVRSVDPSGLISRMIPAERVIGCVVYPAAELVAPGVIRHIEGDRFPVGELDGSSSCARDAHIGVLRQRRPQGARARQHSRGDLAQALGQSDLQPDQCADAFHAGGHLPVSADPRAGGGDDDRGAGDRRKARHHVSRALDKRIAGAEKVGKHKTSMLQDIEAGRAPEIEALVGSVVELGRLTHTPTPQHRRGLRAHQSAGAHAGAIARRSLSPMTRWVRFQAGRPGRLRGPRG